MEESCGAVVFTRAEKGIRYVLVQSLEGKFGFSKVQYSVHPKVSEPTRLRKN